MKTIRLIGGLAAAFAGLAIAAGSATAQQPEDWQFGFQEAHSPIMERVDSFHDLLLVIITAITVIVLGLMIWVMIRYREKRNPNPSRTTHNTLIEVVWTVIPIMILVVIGIPSFNLLYYRDLVPENAEMTIKAIGHQWRWSYEYTDAAANNGDGFAFVSNLVRRSIDASDESEQPRVQTFRDRYGKDPIRLLDTDNAVVIPVDSIVRIQVTSADVIHAWAVPAFGLKIDAVPGRLNEIWLQADEEGWYYGQCSELCGTDHGFMPIAIRVVSRQEYDAWVERSRQWAQNGENNYTIIQQVAADSTSEGGDAQDGETQNDDAQNGGTQGAE